MNDLTEIWNRKNNQIFKNKILPMDVVHYKQEQCNEYEVKNKITSANTMLSCLRCYAKPWRMHCWRKRSAKDKKEQKQNISSYASSYLLPQNGFRFDPDGDFSNGIYILLNFCVQSVFLKYCFSIPK